ncbi:hypothetical protein [Planotetraspora sp. GP83]|uniref:hypothetical protein n=1 Tax=Planotetraspora sp. GP83 TaxID=3156264 RepID=UPI003517F244
MSTDTYAASAAEARTGGDHDRRRLLQSIVEVARAIFAARTSSIFLCGRGARRALASGASPGSGTFRHPARRGSLDAPRAAGRGHLGR